MPEFNPQSLYGKHRFFTEQFLIAQAMRNIDQGILMIDKSISRINIPLIDLLPIEKRRSIAKQKFTNAVEILNEVGVK